MEKKESATAHTLEDFVGARREKFYYCPYFVFWADEI